MKDLRQRIVGLAFIALVLYGGLSLVSAAVQAANHATYFPIVSRAGVSLETVARVTMPFGTYDGVEPTAVQAVSGAWYIEVYRTDSSEGTWIVQWKEGELAAQALSPGLTSPSAAEPVPSGPYTNARGALTCGHDHRIYQFAWDSSQSNTHPILVVGRLLGDTC